MPDPTGPEAAAHRAADLAARKAVENLQLQTADYRLKSLDITDPSVPRAPEPDPEPAPAASSTPAAAAGPDLSAYERRIADLEQLVREARQPQRGAAPAAPEEPAVPELPDLRSYVYPKGHEFEGEPVFDQRLIDAMSARDQAYQATLAELRTELQSARQSVQQARVEQDAAQFDNALAGLPEEYRSVLGEGGYQGMDANSKEYQARVQLYDTAHALVERAAARGERLGLHAAVKRAAGALFADSVPPAARPTRELVRNHQGQFISPPTARRNGSPARPPSEADRDAWALGRLANRMREIGWQN